MDATEQLYMGIAHHHTQEKGRIEVVTVLSESTERITSRCQCLCSARGSIGLIAMQYLVLHGPQSIQRRGHLGLTSGPCQSIQ